MIMKKKINLDGYLIKVLDDIWTIYVEDKLEEEYCDAAAYCDSVTKEIHIRKSSLKTNKVLRHEIVHAFMFSSGLGENFEHRSIGHEETIVDWIAFMFPKMYKVFKELGIDE